MAEYTLTLKSASDYRIIKKLLKAFDGAEIVPARYGKSSLERSLDDVRNGRIAGPFDSVEQLMTDLMN